MSDSRKAAEKDMKQARLGELPTRLRPTNYRQWIEEFKHQAGYFKKAGEEVNNGVAFTFTRMVRTFKVKEDWYDSKGLRTVREVNWTDQMTTKMERFNEGLDKQERDIHEQRGILWSAIYRSFVEEIVSRLKATKLAALNTLQATYDCVGLVKLLKEVCAGMSVDRLEQLREELRVLRFNHKEELFDTFMVRLESIQGQLEEAGDTLTERQKARQLSEAVDQVYWASCLGECLQYSVGDLKHPKMQELKARMSQFSVSKEAIRAKGKGKREREEPAKEPQAKKQKTAPTQPELAQVFKVLSETLPGLLKDYQKGGGGGRGRGGGRGGGRDGGRGGRGGGRGRGGGKGAPPDAAALAKSICWVCKQRGHRTGSELCSKPDVLCAKCGSKRHDTQFCEEVQKLKESSSSAAGVTAGKGFMVSASEIESDYEPEMETLRPNDGDHLSAASSLFSGLSTMRIRMIKATVIDPVGDGGVPSGDGAQSSDDGPKSSADDVMAEQPDVVVTPGKGDNMDVVSVAATAVSSTVTEEVLPAPPAIPTKETVDASGPVSPEAVPGKLPSVSEGGSAAATTETTAGVQESVEQEHVEGDNDEEQGSEAEPEEPEGPDEPKPASACHFYGGKRAAVEMAKTLEHEYSDFDLHGLAIQLNYNIDHLKLLNKLATDLRQACELKAPDYWSSGGAGRSKYDNVMRHFKLAANQVGPAARRVLFLQEIARQEAEAVVLRMDLEDMVKDADERADARTYTSMLQSHACPKLPYVLRCSPAILRSDAVNEHGVPELMCDFDKADEDLSAKFPIKKRKTSKFTEIDEEAARKEAEQDEQDHEVRFSSSKSQRVANKPDFFKPESPSGAKSKRSPPVKKPDHHGMRQDHHGMGESDDELPSEDESVQQNQSSSASNLAEVMRKAADSEKKAAAAKAEVKKAALAEKRAQEQADAAQARLEKLVAADKEAKRLEKLARDREKVSEAMRAAKHQVSAAPAGRTAGLPAGPVMRASSSASASATGTQRVVRLLSMSSRVLYMKGYEIKAVTLTDGAVVNAAFPIEGEMQGDWEMSREDAQAPDGMMVSDLSGAFLRGRMERGDRVVLEQVARVHMTKGTLKPRPEHMMVDTGANVMMIRDAATLETFVEEAVNIRLEAANSTEMAVSRQGVVRTLGRVVVSSDTSVDILSVPGACSTTPGLTFTFNDVGVYVTHPEIDDYVFGPLRSDGLYYIPLDGVHRLIHAGRKISRAHPVMASSLPGVQPSQSALPSGDVSSTDGASGEVVSSDDGDVGEVPGSRAGVPASVVSVAATAGVFDLDRVLSPREVRRAHELRYLHNVLGHPSDEQLINALSNGIIVGSSLTARDATNCKSLLGECLVCQAARQPRPHYTNSVSMPTSRIGERVYVDIYMLGCTKEQPTVYGSYSYMLIAVDSYCGMLHVPLLVSKHTEHLIDAFKILIALYKERGHTISNVISDSEKNFGACGPWLGLQGVPLLLIEPGQHGQRVERQVQSVGVRKRCLKIGSPLVIPHAMEGEVTYAAVQYLNDTANSNNVYETPRMRFEGRKVDLTARNQLPFGTVAMVRYEDQDTKALLGVVLGPSTRTEGSNRCFVFKTGMIVNRGKRSIEPTTVIPEFLPWKVKKGAENITHKPDKRYKPSRSQTGKALKEAERRFKKLELARRTVAAAEREYNASSADGTSSAEVAATSTDGSSSAEATGSSHNPSSAGVQTLGGDEENDSELVPIVQKVKVSTPLTMDEALGAAMKNRESLVLGKRKAQAEAIQDQEQRVKMARLQVEEAELQKQLAGAGAGNLRNWESSPDGSSSSERRETLGSQSQRQRKKDAAAMKQVPAPAGSRASNRLAAKQVKAIIRQIKLQSKSKNPKGRMLRRRCSKLSAKEGLDGEHAEESREAIIGEILNMLHYQVGHYVRWEDIPADKRGNILQSFMFLKHKETPDGRYDKTKARLVGNGATQKQHMYDLVSSSTVALSSVFLLCNLASYHRAKLTTYDIKGAFLHAAFGPSDEVTYIRINKEVTSIWVEQDPSALPFVDQKGTLLLELDKFIYGLKQSPLKFQQHLAAVLTKLGYTQLTQDECLYIKHEGKDFSLLSTHVDDIMQVATQDRFYSELKAGLIEAYKDITTHEEGDAYLGMSIERSKEDSRYIKLSQRGLIDKVIAKYPKQPGDHQRHYSPSGDNLFDVNEEEENVSSGDGTSSGDGRPGNRDCSPEERSEFLSALMTLMYLARLTRPDILMGVTFLACRTHCATLRDVGHLLSIVRYLEGTKDLAVHINCDSLQLFCSCDASFAVHTPGNNTKGHTGFIVGFGNSMSYLHSRSCKQKLGSTSSSDAEILALCEALKFCVWMRELIRELHVTELQPVHMYQDNKSVIVMCTSAAAQLKNSKHLLTKLTYVRHLVVTGAVDIEYLATGDMTADVLTKPLHGEPFYQHVKQMMGLRWSDKFTTSNTILARLRAIYVRAMSSA